MIAYLIAVGLLALAISSCWLIWEKRKAAKAEPPLPPAPKLTAAAARRYADLLRGMGADKRSVYWAERMALQLEEQEAAQR